jgi:hypothetical protein
VNAKSRPSKKAEKRHANIGTTALAEEQQENGW